MASKKISLLLSGVDGTLVNSKKRITARAKAAIEKVHEAGIKFAVTSGRPPRGLKMIIEQVKLSAPIAAFNGGTFVEPDTMKVLNSQRLDTASAPTHQNDPVFAAPTRDFLLQRLRRGGHRGCLH
jgi:HAD superfamily hydrolase (TIGR01484 family)